MNKKTLIAGGAGFIGSHLCKKLAENNEVVCIDNLITGNENNFLELRGNSNFSFIKADINEDLPDEIRKMGFSEIYNLACPASPVHYQQFPLETLKVCASGTENLLKLAKVNNAKFLHASTSEIYGDPLVHPQTEEYWGNVNCTGPRSCYDEGKRYAESLVINFSNIHNIDAKIIRIFNTYGPQMAADDGRAVPEFIAKALKNEDINIFGDGKQTRSFCYVDDMVNGIISLMNSSCSGPINIGNPDERSIEDLAKLIIKITSSSSKIIFTEKATDDPMNRKPDISKAEKLLNFKPKIALEEGLQKTIEWFRNN